MSSTGRSEECSRHLQRILFSRATKRAKLGPKVLQMFQRPKGDRHPVRCLDVWFCTWCHLSCRDWEAPEGNVINDVIHATCIKCPLVLIYTTTSYYTVRDGWIWSTCWLGVCKNMMMLPNSKPQTPTWSLTVIPSSLVEAYQEFPSIMGHAIEVWSEETMMIQESNFIAILFGSLNFATSPYFRPMLKILFRRKASW